MTTLERLIRQHVEGAIVVTLSATAERIAEEIAREYLKDPGFKAEMQATIRRQAEATIATLRRNGTPARRRAARRIK
jgi:hypothetical protein